MQISSTSAAVITPPPATSLNEVTAKERETRKTVDAAIKTLNQSQLAGPGREYSISIDPQTRQPIVQIVDSSTREVIDQIPEKYIVDVAASLNAANASNNEGSSR